MLLVRAFVLACSENVDGANEAESGSDAIKAKDVDKRMLEGQINERHLERMNYVMGLELRRLCGDHDVADLVKLQKQLQFDVWIGTFVVRRSNGLLL